jgi:hypothetical protein
MPGAGVGMAINIFSSITRLFNAPLLAVTTSAVAAASAEGEREDKQRSATAAAAADADDLACSETLDAAEDEQPAAASAGAQGSALKQPLLQRSTSRVKGSSKHTRLSAAVSAAIILALTFSFVEVRLLCYMVTLL